MSVVHGVLTRWRPDLMRYEQGTACDLWFEQVPRSDAVSEDDYQVTCEFCLNLPRMKRVKYERRTR